MAQIDAHSVVAMRDNLIALKEMSPMGATRSQVRASVGFLRDVSQNFVRTWRFAGLPDTPRIPAIVHAMSLPKASTVIYFGASEPGQSTSRFVPTLVEVPGVLSATSSALECMLIGEPHSRTGRRKAALRASLLGHVPVLQRHNLHPSGH